jgi:hypothetical protein
MPPGNLLPPMNTDRMSCGEAREKLPLYVGGDLDRDVLDAVRAHLDACGECARRATQATRARRELVSAFHAAEADVANPELWPGIRATLRSEGLIRAPDRPQVLPATARRASGPRRVRWALALAPLAAAAAVVAIVQLSGLSTGTSVPPELHPRPDEIVVERTEPIPGGAMGPSSGGLMPVSADEETPKLVPYGSRVQRVQGAPAGAPIYSVGLPYK